MTAATRKASERRRRAARGEVALSGWLSASDHAALTQMARDSGMTQAQVVSRLIGMRAAVLGLEPVAWIDPGGDVTRSRAYAVEQSVNDPVNYPKALGYMIHVDTDCVSLLADLDAGKDCGLEAAATIRALINERDQALRHSDLTAAIWLNTAKAGNEGEG